MLNPNTSASEKLMRKGRRTAGRDGNAGGETEKGHQCTTNAEMLLQNTFSV